GQAESGARFVFLASTLHKLVLGIWPFWGGGAGKDAGGARYLDRAAPPRPRARARPAVMRGRRRPWMEAWGDRSGATGSLALTLGRPFVIGGEVFEAGPGGVVHLSEGQDLELLVP